MHARINYKKTKKFVCTKCERSFKYEGSYKVHRSKCDNKPSQLQCDLCDVTPFANKLELEQHVRKHTSGALS